LIGFHNVVTEQIPLRFGWRDGLSFNNYFVGDPVTSITAANAEAVHYVRRAAEGDASAEQFLYLWGAASVGKSHLLQAACQHAAENQRTVAYLPMAELIDLSVEIFDGLEQMSLVCLDDVQLIAGKPEWEEALFHFYNRMRDAGGALLVTANVAPSALAVALPDLQSRLSWGPVVQLNELDDADKIAALQLRAEGRGFELPDEVAQFLMRRSARDMASLFVLLDRLDEASLIQQRKLTIPFVRDLI
jgi:DnaA family protein